MSKYMDQKKPKVVYKAFVTPHFSYCLLMWMSHSRNMKHCINGVR